MGMETHQPTMNNSRRSWVPTLILLVVVTLTIISLHAQASSVGVAANRIGVAKTIRSEEDGDVIDCVDIYKQPAFTHPLLKDHIIQMKPSSYPNGIIEAVLDSNPELVQSWHKNGGGSCPTGTIPIARSKLNVPRKMTRVPISFPDHDIHLDGRETDPTGHEFVQASIVGGYYYGATANINVWSPKVEEVKEFSTAQLWVYSGPEVNVIEFGWMVTKEQNQPTIFTSWTRDEYNSTGCYNLECPGFVQTSTKYALGSPIAPVSTYGAPQAQVLMTIHKDLESGNWWVCFQGEEMGYFPSSIFTSLAESGKRVSWGGEVMNSEPGGSHTTTEMGSGHYPSEGFSKASYFQNVAYIDSDGEAKDPERMETYLSREPCYAIDFTPRVPSPSPGAHFYFGGPGSSPACTF